MFGFCLETYTLPNCQVTGRLKEASLFVPGQQDLKISKILNKNS